MTTDFFETDKYFVDKKNNFQESYHIYNDKRERIGKIKQKLTALQKIIGLAISKKILPFAVEIRSANGRLEASIFRKGIFPSSEIIVQDAFGKKVGVINQKFSFSKPEFKVLNASNEVIAKICDVWKKSDFIINDASENQIGSIDKNWNNSMKNAIRSAKSYKVNIMTNYASNEEKIAILASVIIINAILN
jgi:uncharacterized protein YxjI